MIESNNIKVFLNNEYGYRTFTWEPGMSEDQFVSWWENLTDTDIIKYYFNINTLPGKITAIDVIREGDSRTRTHGDPKDHTPHYYCHFHDVDDSFICIGEQKYSYRRTSRRDWKDNWIDYQMKNKTSEEVV